MVKKGRGKTKGRLDRLAHQDQVDPPAPPALPAHLVPPGVHPLEVLGVQLQAHQSQEEQEGWILLHNDPPRGEEPRTT